MKSKVPIFRRVINIAVICIFAVLISCVMGSYAIAKLGLKLPDWTNVGIERSYFDGRAYQGISKPTLSTIQSGDFQKQIEQWASDHIPFRNQMLIVNATLQRNGIRVANILTRFDCYPTYYNSDQIETSDIQHVLFAAHKVTDADIARMNTFANNLNQLASEYPEVNFVIFALDDNRWSDANPSAQYITNSCSDEVIEKELWQHLDEDIIVLTNADLDYSQYFDYFLSTEHHWTFKGWSEAYEEMAEVLNWKSFKDSPVYSLSEYPSFGGTARLGLDLDAPKYILEEYDLEFPNLQWEVDGEAIPEPGDRQVYRNGGKPESRMGEFQLYGEYYGENYKKLVISNSEAINSDDAIVITNSQGKALLFYIAQNYETLIKLDPANYSIDAELRELIEDMDCKDLIFILEPQSIASENLATSKLFE